MVHQDMFATEDPVEESPGSGFSGNDVLFLALYLILLAFFIMLTANASPSERKVEAVVEGFRPDFRPVPVAVDTSALVASQVEERLIEVFASHLPKDDWRIQTLDGRIEVELPTRRVFPPGSSVLQPRRISMVRKLSEVLGHSQSVDGLHLRMVVGGEDTDVARRRTAALARDLLRHGVDADRFEAGYDTTVTDTIRLLMIAEPAGSH